MASPNLSVEEKAPITPEPVVVNVTAPFTPAEMAMLPPLAPPLQDNVKPPVPLVVTVAKVFKLPTRTTSVVR